VVRPGSKLTLTYEDLDDEGRMAEILEKARARATRLERDKWLSRLNEQQYQVFQGQRAGMQRSKPWVDTVAEFNVRSATITAKIKDLMPDLHEITVGYFYGIFIRG
jgi:hypothetical protein